MRLHSVNELVETLVLDYLPRTDFGRIFTRFATADFSARKLPGHSIQESRVANHFSTSARLMPLRRA
jgi:hypothetical protein